MLQMVLLAHLLGDYVFQGDRIAAWKSRSVWGVVVHGAIVTLFTWLCAWLVWPGWWPYALLIGAAHIAIDVARTRVKKAGPGMALLLFLLDQALHLLVILLAVRASGWIAPRPAWTALGRWLQAGSRLPLLIGYVLLSMPAWVLVHFLVNGMGAVSRSLPGRPGEKYVGMLERGLIATFILSGQFMVVPLVLVPRLAIDAPAACLDGERIGYLGELLVSVSLAVGVGLILRQFA